MNHPDVTGIKKDPADAALGAYRRAVMAKDVEGVMELFSQDAVIFDTWDRWDYVGLADWRAMVYAWFDSLGKEQVLVEAAGLRSHISGDLAAGHAFLTFAAIGAEGHCLRSIVNRATLLLRHEGLAWKIVHAHMSLPLDFGSRTPLPTLRR
jgi:ketosteroid isomerase-like protein